MRKSALNAIVDAAFLLVMLAMVGTGLIVRFALPPGTGGRGGGGGLAIFSMGRHDWGDLHFWLAVTAGALLAVHIALHWSWVCAAVARWILGRPPGTATAKPWVRHVYGAGFLAALVLILAALVWVAFANVKRGGGGETLRHSAERPASLVHEEP